MASAWLKRCLGGVRLGSLVGFFTKAQLYGVGKWRPIGEHQEYCDEQAPDLGSPIVTGFFMANKEQKAKPNGKREAQLTLKEKRAKKAEKKKS